MTKCKGEGCPKKNKCNLYDPKATETYFEWIHAKFVCHKEQVKQDTEYVSEAFENLKDILGLKD